MTYEFTNKSPRLKETMKKLEPVLQKQLEDIRQKQLDADILHSRQPVSQEVENKARQRLLNCQRLGPSTPSRTRLLTKFNGV